MTESELAHAAASAVGEEATALLEHIGLIAPGEPVRIEPLSGGVSSDIWLVRRGAEKFVLKRAREQLKVAADWRAPVGRGASEAAWLEYVGTAVPGCTPRVLATDAVTFAIALEYLEPDEYRNWKSVLMAGEVNPGTAETVGRLLGQIHASSTRKPGLANRFANQELFESLRIEPYLLRTADAVPESAHAIADVVDGLRTTQLALVHGDLSPKNILVGTRPIIIDAECATWGDPAFDAAFCLTHLALKEVHLAPHRLEFREASQRFERAYLNEVTWEPPADTHARIMRILPALLLARVAGASPVEYLDHAERAKIKAIAVEALRSGDPVWELLDQETGANS
ncbi:phosphotransferase family protein [Rathayibacter soli]|uniref:phosphotransferase family protein n=1 Tax=Rathayibacter soli TaxID=3144168 RepID=UPI0027E5BAE9|nr:aminoglycoside phosphotransferase family protein [Glaciibacter superstes]